MGDISLADGQRIFPRRLDLSSSLSGLVLCAMPAVGCAPWLEMESTS